MDIAFGTRDEIRQTVATGIAAEYDRVESVWRALESKAQGTIAVAGVFAGFALNFSKDIPKLVHPAVKLTTIATVILIALSILYSALALRVRGMARPPSGMYLRKLAEDFALLESEQERCEYRPVLQKMIIDEWSKAASELQAASTAKADYISSSQGLLLFAILSAAILAMASATLSPTP